MARVDEGGKGDGVEEEEVEDVAGLEEEPETVFAPLVDEEEGVGKCEEEHLHVRPQRGGGGRLGEALLGLGGGRGLLGLSGEGVVRGGGVELVGEVGDAEEGEVGEEQLDDVLLGREEPRAQLRVGRALQRQRGTAHERRHRLQQGRHLREMQRRRRDAQCSACVWMWIQVGGGGGEVCGVRWWPS